MSAFSSSPDSSENSSAKDPRPAGQRNRAEHAHLNPNDPAKDAEAGTPNYGTFGKADETEPPIPSNNDGSNDNPDEFSEFRDPSDAASEDYGVAGDFDSTQQQGHVEQNQASGEVKNAQHADTDVQRAAWSDDDPRYAGGKAKASWSEENSKEHTDND